MVNSESIDTRFALVTKTGELAYPYMKREKKRGMFGFALCPLGKRDRNGEGEYTTDIEEVVKRVVFDGWGVRVKSNTRPGNTLRIGFRVVTGYKIAPELAHLVYGAPMPPTP